MEKLIVLLILGGSLYYTGKRIYKQIKGQGCSSCDCSSNETCCSYNKDITSK